MRRMRFISDWRISSTRRFKHTMVGTTFNCSFSTTASLALSVAMLSLVLWLMRHYPPGTFRWDGAHTYLLQCAAPFRRDIEPAMLGPLPPVVCHALGLQGNAPLVLPGLESSQSQPTSPPCPAAVARLAFRFRRDAGLRPRPPLQSQLVARHGRARLGPGSVLFVICFSNSSWGLAAACLFCPWVDEHFLIGLPLALAVRWTDRGKNRAGARAYPRCGSPRTLSCAFRFHLIRPSRSRQGHSSRASFIRSGCPSLGPACLVDGAARGVGAGSFRDRAPPRPSGCGCRPHPARLPLLAADMSRSCAVLIPLVLFGGFQFLREHPEWAPRAALTVGVANLLIPAAHVTFTKFDPINNLLIEFLRLFHT